MPVTQLEVHGPLKQVLFFESILQNTADGIKGSPGVLYSVQCDNTANSSASYVKLYDLGSGSVTVGSSPEDFILKILPNSINSFFFSSGSISGGAASGVPFAVGLSAAATDSAGNSPASPVRITICFGRTLPIPRL